MLDSLVIFAGGLGTRISEESHLVPKPFIELRNKACILHLMDYYASFGVTNFVVLAGYKSSYVRQYFSNLSFLEGDFLFENENSSCLNSNKVSRSSWKIEVLDTGLTTKTSKRFSQLKRSKLISRKKSFFLTYGDGLSDIDLNSLYEFHTKQNTLCTLSAVRPPPRFGSLTIGDDSKVVVFNEKSKLDERLINGGFFVCSSAMITMAEKFGDVMFEEALLPDLASKMELSAFYHDGFWQPMDAMRDKIYLESLIDNNEAPWVVN